MGCGPKPFGNVGEEFSKVVNILKGLSRHVREFSLHETFKRDVGWNVSSLAVLGVSGILLNVVIVQAYGAAVLGVFNQVLACFIIFSQLTSGGLAFSILKYSAEYADNREELSKVVSSAAIIAGGIALVVCIAIWLSAGWIGHLLESPGVTVGLRWVIPGLWCIAVNKVLMFSLNGVGHMRFFASAQALRYLLVILTVVACSVIRVDGYVLPVAFSVAEAILLLILVPYTFTCVAWTAPWRWGGWVRKHVVFGLKALPSGLMLEANTRVDILMLGYFTTDHITGVYSFAALLVEGLAQIPVAILVNVNPLLTRQFTSGDAGEIGRTVKRIRTVSMMVTLLVGLLVFASFPWWVGQLFADPSIASGWPIVGILAAGVVLASGYGPFQMILNQVGRPGLYALFVLVCISTNVLFNAIWIPVWGMYGAASATALSLVASVFYLKWFVWRSVGIRI